MFFLHRLISAGCLFLCLLTVTTAEEKPVTLAVEITLRQARQLLTQDEVNNAVILLESQLAASRGHADYLAVTIDAYRKQMDRFQREGKLTQASQVWEKLQILQPGIKLEPASTTVVKQAPATPVKESAIPHSIQAAEAAFAQGNYAQACQCFEKANTPGAELPDAIKERFAYCKLHQVAQRLNDLQGQAGADRPQLEREVRAALELAPRLEFGKELLQRLQASPKQITTAIRHLDKKEQGWSVCETRHFKVFHTNAELAEQVAQIAETTRAAVINKWLGQDYTWEQPCQIFVHPTADSYHRQSGMPATAPGHSDYDANKEDASVIHYRRVFVRADHAHMLTAILPHEVTHVVLNGQFGRRLLPRWADEGMAVLSEPYARIEMHLEPLPQKYQQGQSLSVQELLSVENYPQDRSKVASFYGQSVCLVEYLTNLKGPRAFVAFMRDANSQGDAAALQKHYGLSIQDLDGQLQSWIVSQKMPTLMRVNTATR